jgi:hypothetical protein
LAAMHALHGLTFLTVNAMVALVAFPALTRHVTVQVGATETADFFAL